MLIPHLHFNGNCKQAIAFYESAFGTKAEHIVYQHDTSPECDQEKIAHAVMDIHGQSVFLNDRFGKIEPTTDIAIHLIVVFPSKREFISCYEKMKENSITIDPLESLPYSSLAVQFIDQFGVQWGFMIDENLGG
jgi:PhnB protein